LPRRMPNVKVKYKWEYVNDAPRRMPIRNRSRLGATMGQREVNMRGEKGCR
jgi:hypothetical protein